MKMPIKLVNPSTESPLHIQSVDIAETLPDSGLPAGFATVTIAPTGCSCGQFFAGLPP